MSDPALSSEIVLPVHGMTCGGCVASVERALLRVSGVESVDVSLAGASARVRYQPEQVVRADLVQAVEAAGFAVSS